mmetsp:Transcript_19204/g.31894  ORF Transcript_19204/g.31894 Transcript_19204/m.31894 type:complete len:370 (+) Transcript_19204:94-1203(+)
MDEENNIRLEEAFALIGKGNQFEEEDDNWEAAQCFTNAMSALFQLAVELEPSTPAEERVEELYQAQCREYLHRARRAFIHALTSEDAVDHDQSSAADGGAEDPKFITLSNEQAKERVQLFSTLFSKELDELGLDDLELLPTAPAAEDGAAVVSSLEERLRSLNDSLIPSLKTDQERMKNIDQTLKGLGVNVYSHADQQPKGIDIPVSKEDQIAQIMAQAKDEAIYDVVHGNKDSDVDDVILTDDEDSDVDEEEDEFDLSVDLVDDIPKLLNKKAIRKCVINAQVKLAQLVALLDTPEPPGKAFKQEEVKKDTKKDNEDDNGDSEKDDDESDEDQTPAERVEFDLEQARMLLLKANKNLSKAVSKWEVEQ